MKMLMMIVESEYKEQLEVLLDKHEIVGYTEIPQVFGSGATGTRMGSRAFPKTSALLFTVIPKEQLDQLLADIQSYIPDYQDRLKLMVLPVEQII